MNRYFTTTILLCFFSLLNFSCHSQKKHNLYSSVSLDYGFGKYFNNRATTISINYIFFDQFGIAPAFSYFIEKDNMKMNAFSLEFIYLFSDVNDFMFPKIKNKGIYYYPIFGFYVVNSSGLKSRCSDCSPKSMPLNNHLILNFGFDFGVGVEYELPTSQNIFRNMSVKFETVYIAVENNYRPLVRFGLIYNIYAGKNT